MDPNLMKFLEEDEDETMHSGADVEALTAELNRDIEGNASTPQQQPSDSNTSIKGSSQSHFLQQWQTSSHDGVANFQSMQDLMAMEEKEQHSSQVDMQKHGSDSHNRKEDDNSSHEPNPLLHNPSMDGCPLPSDERNTFPLSQPMVTQTSAEQPINMQGLDREPKTENEPQMDKVQNISRQPSMSMGLNDQQSSPMEFKDQHSLLTGQGNQQTDMVISSEQVMPPGNQHLKGMMMNSQQSMNSAMSNQQSMTNSNQQAGTSLKLNKQVPFGMLLPIIQPQLDKDRAMQLHTLYFKLKKNEITKDGFVRHMRSIVGDHMLKMAVYKLQTQASMTATNQFQSQSQAPARQMQVPSSAQLPTDLSNSTSENSAAKSREVESQADSQGLQVSQMSNFSSGALSHERKHPAFPQGLNKQQHMQFPQASFPAYGNAGSSYSPFPATNAASSASIRPQSHDPQMRQAPLHPNMAINHLGQTPRAMNMTNMSKFERPHALSDPKKMMPENLTHMNSNMALQQNHVSSMTYVKQEPPDQTNEQHKAQLSSSHGLSSLTPPVKLGSAAPGNLKDEYFEMQSSRTGPNPPTSLVSTNSVPSPVPSPLETNVSSNSRMPSLTSSIGPAINSKAPLKKPLVGQKKPIETPGSSPPSSKKQKVSGGFLDQSIEHLNDVTAVSGVNLREEEEQLFSGPKEDSRVSEASRRVVQEEEDKLILQKIPLQKKVMEIMVKCGLKNMSNDVERCLSLCVEERMRGLISNIIRLSKQRVDIEKPRHKTIITSDVRQQIMTINRKAHEEWEKKQAETEKSKKLNEPDSNGVDGDKEKDESRSKSTKANKEEDDKMRTTAANVAVRAATGVSDMLSRWQLMAEKQKQGGSDTVSQTSKDVGRKQAATSTRSTREHQESEKRDSSAAFTNPASVRKVGRNQLVVPRVARSISVKDVIGVLEREPQMSKSMLLYRLYQKVSADSIVE